MARRIIINNILNLIKDIGGNPNKFMGTKSNINFLGKGPKEALFQGQIDIDGLMQAGFPIERVVTEAERAGGYVTANKLNDFQLQRLQENLITLKKAYFPEQIPNITDLGTGTRDLTQEGIASLREGQRRFPKESHQFMGRPLKDADFAEIDRLIAEGKLPGNVSDALAGAEGVEAAETILPTGGLMGRISDRMKKIKDMSDEMGAMGKGEPTKAGTFEILDPTAEKVSYASRFNPKNEVHVEKAKALLEDPQIKGLYTEAEVKNAFDFEGLYQTHFDKGHVDVAVLLEQAGHNIPMMRASARDALLNLMKKEKGLPGAESGLKDFVSDIDFKYISEGGGGRAGDPINLFVKYFGKNAAENLPKNPTKENIDVFTDFIMAVKDRRGRGINDPFFDRESIDFSKLTGLVDEVPPFKTGGRVGFKWGSRKGVEGLMKLVNKKFGKDTLKKASDVAPSTKYETLAAVSDFERREMIRNKYQGLIDDDLLHNILNDTNIQHQAEVMATIDEMLMMQNVKGMGPEAIIESFKESWKRKKNASGGLAKILEV